MKKLLLIIIFIFWIITIYYHSIENKQIIILNDNNYLSSIKEKNTIVATKHIDIFEQELRQAYKKTWIEIEDFFIDNKKARFAHIFNGKTFVCMNGKLIFKYQWEKKEIFSYDKEILNISPCSFKVTQTEKDHIFLIDFCLSSWWGSGECLWIDMYYNINTNNWSEGKLFFTWYKDNKMVKLPVDKNNINWKYFHKDYEEFNNYIFKYYWSY